VAPAYLLLLVLLMPVFAGSVSATEPPPDLRPGVIDLGKDGPQRMMWLVRVETGSERGLYYWKKTAGTNSKNHRFGSSYLRVHTVKTLEEMNENAAKPGEYCRAGCEPWLENVGIIRSLTDGREIVLDGLDQYCVVRVFEPRAAEMCETLTAGSRRPGLLLSEVKIHSLWFDPLGGYSPGTFPDLVGPDGADWQETSFARISRSPESWLRFRWATSQGDDNWTCQERTPVLTRIDRGDDGTLRTAWDLALYLRKPQNDDTNIEERIRESLKYCGSSAMTIAETFVRLEIDDIFFIDDRHLGLALVRNGSREYGVERWIEMFVVMDLSTGSLGPLTDAVSAVPADWAARREMEILREELSREGLSQEDLFEDGPAPSPKDAEKQQPSSSLEIIDGKLYRVITVRRNTLFKYGYVWDHKLDESSDGDRVFHAVRRGVRRMEERMVEEARAVARRR
jgi:hypothetical protein